MALVAALALVSGASMSGGGPNWQTPADLGATPMPTPIVRVSAACGFSCALGRVAKAGRGGTVLVPRGVWVSPPVNLTSHLTVYLAAGAVVKADTNVFRDGKWPLIQPLPTYGRGHPDYNSSVNKNFWGARWAPFINGYNLTHVTIGGENGTIDGSGAYWWARHFAGLEQYTRPPLFSCLRCNDVLLEDTTFKDSAFWTIHPVLGRRLTARRLHLLAPNVAPNTDGFDPDSIRDVVFTDSYVSNGDDAIAIKAGWDCAGYASAEAAPCDNIYIRNITQNRGGGGLSLGSEMSGGISNVVIEDCKLLHGSYGIQIKTGITRGGFVKNVSISNVEIVGTTKEAIRIDAFYGMNNTWCPQPSKRVPSVVDNIRMTNVTVRNANLSVHFAGAPDVPATRVHLRNVSFACDGGQKERCGGPGVKTGCCIAAECLGGVQYTADAVTPAGVMRSCAPQPQLAAAGALRAGAAAGPAADPGPGLFKGVWRSKPAYCPVCTNYGGPEVGADPSRNYPCNTSDRAQHHIVDAPVLGNGNVGVAVGSNSGDAAWIDLYVSTNSFWAVWNRTEACSSKMAAAHKCALPATMAMGIIRLALPRQWDGAAFYAEQDIATATVTVNFTAPSALALGGGGAPPDTLSVKMYVSPAAPVLWTSLRYSSAAGGALPVNWSTSVKDHFFKNVTGGGITEFAVAVSATCQSTHAAAATSASTVTRASFKPGGPAVVTGALRSELVGGAAQFGCSTAGNTGTTQTLALQPHSTATIATIVRTDRDPPCVPRPAALGAPLCDLPPDAALAAGSIAAHARLGNLSAWAAAHQRHWAEFYNASNVSLPQAPETEAFWKGALYILGSSIPKAGQDLTPPGLYGPWGTIDDPGWHGDYTLDYNYEAIFYGVMSSNHPELMASYYQPLLDYMPKARAAAPVVSKRVSGKACPGLRYPDHAAPWGFDAAGFGSDGMSNGPFTAMPAVWAWEPLVKGNADFFACYLELINGSYHDPADCGPEQRQTNPKPCADTRDFILTMPMAAHTLKAATGIAAALGETADPMWDTVLSNLAPYPTASVALPNGIPAAEGPTAAECSFCPVHEHSPAGADCQQTRRGTSSCGLSQRGVCPPGMLPCSTRIYGEDVVVVTGRVGGSAGGGGNPKGIFPAFPGDMVGTNASSAWVAANTVLHANAWTQGNAFTKIFSAAARVTGPGLLQAKDVYAQWLPVLKAQQQQNFIPFNPFSGYETVGAIEFVNYMLLQSDPGGFLGLFEAWPAAMDASFRRLRGRGAFLVSSALRGGVVLDTTVVSEQGLPCTFRSPESWAKRKVAVTDVATGSAKRLVWQGNTFFTFATDKGAEYLVRGS